MTVTDARPGDRRMSPVFAGILAVTAVTGWATWTGFAEQPGVAVFLFVTAAWIVSLCLHEYAHARTALHSGDITVGIPENASVLVQTAVANGDVSASFGLPTSERTSRRRQQFRFGAGSASLELETFSGDINLVRPSEIRTRNREE